MDDPIYSNESIELLMKYESNNCPQLVDGICHRTKPKYDDYSKVWSLQEWWSLADAYTELYRQAVKHCWSKDQLLSELSGIREEYQSVVCDVLTSREKDIRNQLLLDSHAISHATMTDFDWKLKLVMGSDKLSTVHEPLLSVDLDVQMTDGRKTVSMELNREQLSGLISSLEAANKALLQLKS
ncbi:COMD8-like protein [Mya arenaria]|uniref:COMD8-like protein n=1 Tax=Mya arenaria TaxID=6604 RepID=A0ABY7DLP3_MYAAR|nr:COMD8-like protein [Mya arenaria]